MTHTIKDFLTRGIIIEAEAESLKHLLEGAVRDRVDLSGADLSGADLRGADLGSAVFRFANLSVVDFRGADLTGAHFDFADLRTARLDGARCAWTSRDVVSELLRRAAGDDIGKLKVAGLALVQRHWCWREFFALGDPLSHWAMETLAAYVRPDDGAPESLRRIAESKGYATGRADPHGVCRAPAGTRAS
jgi:hypothetical protein